MLDVLFLSFFTFWLVEADFRPKQPSIHQGALFNVKKDLLQTSETKSDVTAPQTPTQNPLHVPLIWF